jgi:succinylglutamic semialdehyde dehydrogenase
MIQGAHFINGCWQEGHGALFEKCNPSDNSLLWTGHGGNESDVAQAVSAARSAFPEWALIPFDERVALLKCFAENLGDNVSQLSQVIAQETGKPEWEAKTEVQAMINKVQISIDAYHQRTGERITAMADGQAVLRHRPHGVLAVFGPYNFPGHLPNGHIVPALLAGNCVIFKPSELTPWTAQITLEIWQKSGLPDGVLNLIQGGKETGVALSSSSEIDGLLFTGSANTGYQLHRQLAGQPEKILALEMGGNNALIVDNYDNLDAAVNIAVQSAFISAGQRCTCARRLLVRTGTAGDVFVERLVAITARLRVGKWNDLPAPFMGSVITKQAAEQMVVAQENLCALGAKLLLELKLLQADSALLSPGIVDATGIDSLPDEEYFGPLLTLIRYDHFAQAIEIANHTRFGLATGLVSTDRDHYDQLLLTARAGIVNWNKPLTGASSNAPFGGVGASGNHRASAYYAADYCAWPMASLESEKLVLPEVTLPGLHFS